MVAGGVGRLAGDNVGVTVDIVAVAALPRRAHYMARFAIGTVA